MAPGAISKFGAPMFEREVFRKQTYCIEESVCDIFGNFSAPRVVIRRPRSDSAPHSNSAPEKLWPPSYAPAPKFEPEVITEQEWTPVGPESGILAWAGARFGIGFLNKNLTRYQAKFLTSRHVCMHRVIFHISNTLRKLMNWWLGLRVWCLGKCVGLGFMLGLEKGK